LFRSIHVLWGAMRSGGVMEETPAHRHRLHAPRRIDFGLITVSTSRYEALARGEEPPEDVSYSIARSLVEAAGHRVVYYRIVPDRHLDIVAAVMEASGRGARVVVTMGGTGPARSDVTVEALRPLFRKELEGFGCIFRMLSYSEAGSAAYLSNATAGLVGDVLVYLLPGSPGAVRMAFEKLILPEAGHILGIAGR